jgi:hypothetical protein
VATTNWQKLFVGMDEIQEPRRIVEQYECMIGGVGPIPIVVYEMMDKEFVATTPGWVRFTTAGIGMGASEQRLPPLVGSAGNAKAALENLVNRIPMIKGATWKRAAGPNG